MTPSDMVKEFHEAFGHPVASEPVLPTNEVLELRADLIKEEAEEVASDFADLSDERTMHKYLDLAKELADLIYVVYGAAHTMGLPLDEVVAEVHRSNMSKLGEDGKPIYRADGKVLKGPYYEEADVMSVILKHMRFRDRRENANSSKMV